MQDLARAHDPLFWQQAVTLNAQITQLIAFIIVIYTSELRISTNEGTVPF